ncbi:hypothetical protein HW932_19150 [Allochromatium humboldtianum]|uniref:Uncharacterized protein n=1 Tax=Allochromatium humboldtianum TaxID=504901 RepID=A0A850RPG7_9GAMM|nr:hypothetical protein [Allochromatium humboldtianum]NVZ11371.1 hypothetical protein [Allochromatium humboldtianum]
MSERHKDVAALAATQTRRAKRTKGTINTRTAKAAFIRWARRSDTPAWTHKGAVCWIGDALPSALTGAASSYHFSWAPIRDDGGFVQDAHDTGPVDRHIPPFRRAQFWRYLPRHCMEARA